MTTKTVHFKVDFEGLTRMVRTYWAEGEYTLALSIMTDSGIPINHAHDVIRGKLKMIQCPNDPDAGELTEDDWQPEDFVCYMGRYPDPLDGEWFRLIHKYGTKGLSDLRDRHRFDGKDGWIITNDSDMNTYAFNMEEPYWRYKKGDTFPTYENALAWFNWWSGEENEQIKNVDNATGG